MLPCITINQHRRNKTPQPPLPSLETNFPELRVFKIMLGTYR